MARSSSTAKPLPCPACKTPGAVRAIRADEFELFREPHGTLSERLVPRAKGENKLQFKCSACGVAWVRIKDFERSCATAGTPISPLFG